MKHLLAVFFLTGAVWAQDQGGKGYTSTVPCSIESTRLPDPAPAASNSESAFGRLNRQCYPTTRNGGAPQGYGRSIKVPTYDLYQHQPKGNGNVTPGYHSPQIGGNYPGT